jgi:hypothetical protein
MKYGVCLVLFTSMFSIESILSTKKSRQKDNAVKSQEDALFWLNKYGYNPCLNADVQCSLSFTSLLKEYQQRFRLSVTGQLDSITKQHMSRPRCGNQDKSSAELKTLTQVNPLKWSRSSLTYSLRGYPKEISQTRTASIIRDAFNAWLDYIPMTIESTCSTCKADFILDFTRERHADLYPFDGVGGTLAHAFFPEDGRVHFDKDETWTEE